MDNTKLIIDSKNDAIEMQKILAMPEILFQATNRMIETEKLACFT